MQHLSSHIIQLNRKFISRLMVFRVRKLPSQTQITSHTTGKGKTIYTISTAVYSGNGFRKDNLGNPP